VRHLSIAAGLPLAIASLAGSLAACAGAEPGTPDAAEGASSAAVIVVERTVAPDDTVHGSIVARFLRMRAGSVDDDALRMVGATLDLPAPDTCAVQATVQVPVTGDSPTPGEPRAVELLDVGPVAIEADGVRTALEARSLPDIVDLVSGVVYATRSIEAIEAGGLPSQGLYQLSLGGSGGELELPQFSISAAAPGEPDDLRIDGKDARPTDGLIALAPGGSADLAWAVVDARAPGDLAGDLVYVDIASSGSVAGGGQGIPTTRCQFADRGTATLPASAFGPNGSLESGTLTVHRVHREAFHVGAIESGVVRFDFARSVPFTRR
jgi:hypothetical protein